MADSPAAATAGTARSRLREALSLPPEETRVSREGRDWLVSVVTLLVGGGIVAWLTAYNRRTWIGPDFLLVNNAWLLFVPLLVVFGLFRESAERFGFKRPEGLASRYALVFFLFMVPFLVVACRFPTFHTYYPMFAPAAYDWNVLLYWEVVYGFYMFCWEFFYRGFLTFGLKRAFGVVPAIVLQTAAFGLMHYGKPFPEFIGSFIAGAALGWLAVKGRSFLPCFAIHWAVSISFDLLAIWAKPGGLF